MVLISAAIDVCLPPGAQEMFTQLSKAQNGAKTTGSMAWVEVR